MGAGVPQALRGTLVAPTCGCGTCRKAKGRGYSDLDMFIVSAELACMLEGASCYADYPANPHRPVAIRVEGGWETIPIMSFPPQIHLARECMVGAACEEASLTLRSQPVFCFASPSIMHKPPSARREP